MNRIIESRTEGIMKFMRGRLPGQLALLAAFLLCTLLPCFSSGQEKLTQNRLSAIMTQTTEKSVSITISGNSSPVFSSYMLSHPDRLILDFPRCTVERGLAVPQASSDLVGEISLASSSEDQDAIHLVIRLAQSVDFNIVRRGNSIVVRIKNLPGSNGSLDINGETMLAQNEAKSLEKEREEKQKQLEAERRIQEEMERKKAEELRLKHEEEKKEKQRAEELRLKHEEEERRKAEELRLERARQEAKKAEEERLRREEAKRLKLEEKERQKREQLERLRQEENARIKAKEEQLLREAAIRKAEQERIEREREKRTHLPVKKLKPASGPAILKRVGFKKEGLSARINADFSQEVEVSFEWLDDKTVLFRFQNAKIINRVDTLPLHTGAFGTPVQLIRPDWSPGTGEVLIRVELTGKISFKIMRYEKRIEIFFKKGS